jgi:hypothetical protein
MAVAVEQEPTTQVVVVKFKDRADLVVEEMVRKVKLKPEPQILAEAEAGRPKAVVIALEMAEAE